MITNIGNGNLSDSKLQKIEKYLSEKYVIKDKTDGKQMGNFDAET